MGGLSITCEHCLWNVVIDRMNVNTWRLTWHEDGEVRWTCRSDIWNYMEGHTCAEL